MQLTTLEKTVLVALFVSAKGNGHDFGFVDDARNSGVVGKRLSGVLSSLVKKGIIEDHQNGAELTRATGYPTSSQFTWKMEPDTIEAMIS